MRSEDLVHHEALAHARNIVAATDVPVSADLEKGFGDSPEVVAQTIRLAAEVGLVGCSIEDATGTNERPLFAMSLAVERVAAAAQAARALPFPFTLTARAENYLRGNPDLDDTIRRLQAFERAGADVLFPPGLPDLAAVRTVCASLSKPVNFMVAIPGKSFSVSELSAAGVRRISLATSLYRAAMTGLIVAAREVKDMGNFGYLDNSLTTAELNKFLQSWPRELAIGSGRGVLTDPALDLPAAPSSTSRETRARPDRPQPAPRPRIPRRSPDRKALPSLRGKPRRRCRM